MSLSAEVTALAQRIRDQFNTVTGKLGDLNNLNTTDKANLVAALNEVLSSAGVQINDGATNGTEAWSSTKVQTQIDQAISALINGAGSSADTLKELSDSIAALAQADNGLVSATNAQAFTVAQKTTGRDNIGAASQATLTQFQTDVGDTGHNFVADFETGLV